MFKELLIKSLQDGILILVKYGLMVIVIIYAYLFMQNTYQMALNGNQSALALNEYIKAGYLPAFQNGQIPKK